MTLLPLLYHDREIAVVNKPSGMLVHRTPMDRCATEFALQVLRDQLKQRVYPVHRLDKSTSGVLLFALDRETAGSLGRSFMNGEISKTYFAVVRGFTEEQGRIDHPLKDRRNRKCGGHTDTGESPKEAITEYRRIATAELPYPVGRYATARFSLVKAFPLTGRSHQIRRHMKHISHHIIGDTTYGDGKQNIFFRNRFNSQRLLLHAWEVAFIHPRTEEQVCVRAPFDQDFDAILKEMDWTGAESEKCS